MLPAPSSGQIIDRKIGFWFALQTRGLSLYQLCLEVECLDLHVQLAQTGGTIVHQLADGLHIDHCHRFLQRLVALLHFHVVLDAHPDLLDAFLQVFPDTQCFRKFHSGFIFVWQKYTKLRFAKHVFFHLPL